MANFRNVSLAFILFIEITCIFTGSNAKITGKLGDTATMAKQDSSTTAGTKASKGKNQEPTIDYNKTICGALGKSMAKIKNDATKLQNADNIIDALLKIVKEALVEDESIDNPTKAEIPKITIKEIKNEIAKLQKEILADKKLQKATDEQKTKVDSFFSVIANANKSKSPITLNDEHVKQIIKQFGGENEELVTKSYAAVFELIKNPDFKNGLQTMMTPGKEQEGCLKFMAAPAA